MISGPPDGLDGLVPHIAGRLTHAADSRQGPWRTPVLTTIAADGAPSGRTVVIRSVDLHHRTIEIFSDADAAKVAETTAEPRVSLVFWDPEASEQLRVSATAHRLTDGSDIDARWAAIGPRGHALYPAGPTGNGRSRFAVLQAVWHSWDWLWIGGEPHRRARIDWTDDGETQAAWIDP